ncbi:hypothetical protein HS088_TW13G00060 [Tripterygium wilfordii]|uniref:Uncharacterized protein n=1 Tax=Tripterygium wilfordii TaxID=458696 RepID=A0A7J7CSU4_TRIWF|nr:uncharacterized protein LOC120013389 [Tripterygium wilfordii]KAF5737182.1 hypothetical protein HS088_TW13G00060 [Tripterygium wilfordii]
MEGLIPFVYRAIVQHRNGKEGLLNSWFSESPSASYYARLPGDSGRFQNSDLQLLLSDYCPNSTTSTTSQIVVSTGVQSPAHRLSARRVA